MKDKGGYLWPPKLYFGYEAAELEMVPTQTPRDSEEEANVDAEAAKAAEDRLVTTALKMPLVAVFGSKSERIAAIRCNYQHPRAVPRVTEEEITILQARGYLRGEGKWFLSDDEREDAEHAEWMWTREMKEVRT